MKHLIVAGSVVLALSGCASQIAVPPQPTTASIEAANVQLASLTSSPAQTWWDGDMAVRAACETYLNSAAQGAAATNQLGVGVGIAGAAGSMFNPLAGVASSLVQSFLSAYSAAGAIPYTPETSTLIMGSLDAYEAQVSPPTDQATAMSLVDDEWFLCSPGGYAMTASKALATAQIGTQATSGVGGALFLAGPRSARPVVTVNGR